MSLHKQYTLTTINKHFYDNINDIYGNTHFVIHSKQICDRELKKVKQAYSVATKKRGDLTMYIICRQQAIKKSK